MSGRIVTRCFRQLARPDVAFTRWASTAAPFADCDQTRQRTWKDSNILDSLTEANTSKRVVSYFRQSATADVATADVATADLAVT